MGGYTIEVSQTESAATALSSLKDRSDYADQALAGSGALPAPAAGEGIGRQVETMIAGWHKVFADLSTEMDILGQNVKQAAMVTVQVEEFVGNRFRAFAE